MRKKIILQFAMLNLALMLLLGNTALAAPVYPSFDTLELSETSCMQSCIMPYTDNNIQLMSADETKAEKPLTHQKLLTILIDLNDIQITMGSEFWSKEMFDTTPGALSVVNYWKENSNGLDIFEHADTSGVNIGRTGTVSHEDYTDIAYKIIERADGVVRVSLDIPHPTPTGNEKIGDYEYTKLNYAVQLAFQAIEEDFDFTDEQPHIVTIFAGYGQDKSEGTEGKGHIRGFTSLGGIKTTDGISLGQFTVQPEMLYVDVPDGIGTICHELGHSVFNLPDLYFSRLPNGPGNSIYNYTLMSGVARHADMTLRIITEQMITVILMQDITDMYRCI